MGNAHLHATQNKAPLLLTTNDLAYSESDHAKHAAHVLRSARKVHVYKP